MLRPALSWRWWAAKWNKSQNKRAVKAALLTVASANLTTFFFSLVPIPKAALATSHNYFRARYRNSPLISCRVTLFVSDLLTWRHIQLRKAKISAIHQGSMEFFAFHCHLWGLRSTEDESLCQCGKKGVVKRLSASSTCRFAANNRLD